MTQQGPPPPRSGRNSRRNDWQDADISDDEEYPPWAGLGVLPRYAGDSSERDRRRIGIRDDAPARESVGRGDGSRSRRRDEGRPAGDGGGAPADQRAGARRGDPERSHDADDAYAAAAWGPEPRDRAAADPAPDARRPAGRRTRAAAARIRRGRRTIWYRAAALVAVIVIGVSGWLMFSAHQAPTASSGGLVTTFQPGELKTVPDACSSVTAATLAQYLPGPRRKVSPQSLDGRAQSSCTWSVDAKPLFRLLQVAVQAYAPSGLVPGGDGSATDAAIAAYRQAMKTPPGAYQRATSQASAPALAPATATHQPPPQVTSLHGLGQQAFAAVEKRSAEGATTDVLTVVARVRNVLVTVEFEGLVSRKKPRYGPVSIPQLQSAAVAAARDVLARLG